MRSLTITGLVLLIISALLFYLTTNFEVEELKLSHLMGIMAGIGIGLLLGGIVGYVSKGSSIKEAQKKKEWAQLQQEKLELEKQAAELAQQQANANTITTENKTQMN